MGRIGLPAKLAEAGTRVRELWKNAAARHGLPVVSDDGYPCLAHFRFDHELGNELRTLYTRLMLDRGYLAAVQFYPTLAHTEEVIEAFGRALDGVFAEIAAALVRGDVKERLGGPAAHTGFSRLL
jgi:glutamate-1-semialdehyde 2,1-aminomutase